MKSFLLSLLPVELYLPKRWSNFTAFSQYSARVLPSQLLEEFAETERMQGISASHVCIAEYSIVSVILLSSYAFSFYIEMVA